MINFFKTKLFQLAAPRLVNSLLRAGMNAIGPLLIAHGLMTQDQSGTVVQVVAEYIIGTALPALALWWADREKKAVAVNMQAANAKADVALAMPEGSSRADLNQAIEGMPVPLPPKPSGKPQPHYEFRNGKPVLVK